MPYIGNQPAEQFTSFATQEFSTSATTSYTLDHAVTNENEIALFINNVRQQPGSGKAYTATGTALTLSEATASTDTMYCVFLGRALQTVTPATNSITAAMVGNDLISGKTALGAEPADTDEFLVSDAGTLKRVDYSYIKGGGKINQVLFNDAVVNNTTSSDVEIISQAITPSASNSKVLIIAAFSCQLNSDEYASFDIYRGSLASGTKILDGGEMMFSAANNIRLWSSFTMLDSPSTTSATTYTIVGSPLASGTIQFGAAGRQTLTLMEVLA